MDNNPNQNPNDVPPQAPAANAAAFMDALFAIAQGPANPQQEDPAANIVNQLGLFPGGHQAPPQEANEPRQDGPGAD
jgi:hypothetical protein